MTTKNPFRYSWFWAFMAVALAVPAAHATEVNNITLGRFEDFAVVTLYGDAPLTVTHQLVEAKDGKPNRIVVDVAGAQHALPDNNFNDLPKSSISAIRTSQFAVSPEPVVRVVLDLATPAAYQLKNAGRRIRVMVALPEDPPIPLEWSARDLGTGNAYANLDAPAKQRPSESMMKATPASKPMADATASKPADQPKAKVDVASAQTTATKSTPAADAKPTYAKTDPASAQPQFDDELPIPQPKAKPDQEIHYDIPAPAQVTVTQTPEPATKESKPTVDQDLPQAVKAEPVKTAAKPAEQPAEKPAAKATTVAQTEEANQPEAPATPVPDEGSKPVASLTTLPPVVTSTQIVPDREKVVYRTMGRRDPFGPLIKSGASYNAAALPDVNGLRMVGVLHDVNNSWGLFEDANGYGYILKQGDRVRNGRLAKLTQNKAFFQLTEFGWSRSVQLDLEREG